MKLLLIKVNKSTAPFWKISNSLYRNSNLKPSFVNKKRDYIIWRSFELEWIVLQRLKRCTAIKYVLTPKKKFKGIKMGINDFVAFYECYRCHELWNEVTPIPHGRKFCPKCGNCVSAYSKVSTHLAQIQSTESIQSGGLNFWSIFRNVSVMWNCLTVMIVHSRSNMRTNGRMGCNGDGLKKIWWIRFAYSMKKII